MAKNKKTKIKKVIKDKGVGRPTKYNREDILRKANEYIDEAVDEFIDVVESENEKTGRKRFKRIFKINLPKSEGLALKLGISRSRLYEWAKKYKEFEDILDKINLIQADRVINEALAGNYNPMIAKLLLGKHGYSENINTDITTKGKPIPLLYGIRSNHSTKENTEPREED